MKSVGIRGSVVAAVATIFVLNAAITTPVYSQQAASAANPELAAKGVWNDSTTYVIDDLVTSRGSTWRSKRNGNLNKVPGQTSPSTAAYWELFARGFNPTGVWLNTRKYQPDDLVTRQGQTYRAKLTNTNKPTTNTTYWELLAATGADGATGAQGPQGPAGPNAGIGAGSQSVPSISFNGDANTGIYSPEAGKIAMVEDGVLFLHNLGDENTALGLNALANNNPSSGLQNTAVGSQALASNTTGDGNTAVGRSALATNQTGAHNVAIGHDAFTNGTTSDNTAVGYRALRLATTGLTNTAVGSEALAAVTTGNFNVAVGRLALAGNGSDNVAVGAGALGALSVGTSNVAVGNGALGGVSGGSGNIGIGGGAGSAGNVNNSIFIGADSSLSHTIKIGNTQSLAFIAGIRNVTTAVNDAVPVLIDSNGQLGTASSSRRYKFDIESMADVPAMLTKLRPVTFRYRQAQDDGQHPLQYGLIAEEVAEVFADLAVVNKDGQPETVKYHLLPSFLLAGYQAQQKTVAAQEQKIEALEDRLRRLEALVPQSKAAALQ